MKKVDIDDVDPIARVDGDRDRRDLAAPLGTSDIAINYYELRPGEAFSGGLHAHLDQEEVFYIIEGTATFETKSEATAESTTVEVSAGEAVRFATGEYQQGRNESDGPVVALALGAPRESTEGLVPRPCPECGESDVLSVTATDDGLQLRCPECGAEPEAEL
jgi:uncharacterized cupin superfamily protein